MKRFERAIPLLHDHLSRTAARLPDKEALVAGEERRTYGEIEREANALARTLATRGVERGDRVIIYADSAVPAVVAFWGVLQANAVVSVVNAQTKPDKLAYLIRDCRPGALITDARSLVNAAEALRGASSVRTVVVAGSASPSALDAVPNALAWAEATGAPGEGPPERRALDVDLASIIYTSGSTGEPKGVMLTHRNMLTAATSVRSYLEMGEDDVVLGVLPLSFDYGLYQMIMSFGLGARFVLLKSFAYPAEVLRVVERERVTGFPGVPTLFAMLAEMKELEYDLSSVRFVTNTAAALMDKHIGALRRLFPGARIYSMYGLTECKRVSYLPPEDLDRKPGSVGVPIPNTEVWVVDEEGRPVGPGVVGQLVVRGATVMRGYWDKPEETAKKLRPGPLAGEQVLHTGDYAKLDSEGYLYFVGRMDDIIKSRGEKVAPKEVESALVAIPGISEAAVIGVPDDILGQAIKAFVTLEQGATLGRSEILRECQKRLEPFMVPKHVEVVAALPKTTSGKISKVGLS
jgi:amino acid adenylation domain-containing protein